MATPNVRLGRWHGRLAICKYLTCIRILRAELILMSLFASVRQWRAACYCVHFPVQWIWKVSSTLSFFFPSAIVGY